MNGCIKMSLASLVTQLVLVAGAEIAEKDLWFFTDFDGNAQLNGKAVTLKTSPDGLADGRYGKGCYFHRPIKNTLPPMAKFLTASTNFSVTGGAITVDAAKGRLALSGGTLVIAAQPDPLGYSWVRPEGGATCSFYVRGAKGTAVTLIPSISPTTPEAVKAATKKYKDRGFNPTNQVPDTVICSTNAMDGTWRRVWAAVRHDCRTTDGRKIMLSVATTGPIEMERFQYEQSAVFPYLGNFIPARWTDGGTVRKSEAAKIKDPELLTDFPAERGSASFWVRSVTNDWAYGTCRAFAFVDQPKLEYSFEGEFRPGHYVPGDGEFIRTLLESYEEYSGKKGYCESTGGGTYVHHIPGGVAFGAGDHEFDSRLHGANERARISQLLMTASVYAAVIARLCA